LALHRMAVPQLLEDDSDEGKNLPQTPRKALKRPRLALTQPKPRSCGGLRVVEGFRPLKLVEEPSQPLRANSPKRAGPKRKQERQPREEVNVELSADNATDFFQSSGCAKLQPRAVARVLDTHLDGCSAPSTEYVIHFDGWLQTLLAGFSVLLEGVGAKRHVLQDFIEQKLFHVGCVEWISGFVSRRTLLEHLRALVEFHGAHPTKNNLGGVVAALAEARSKGGKEQQPLFLVVHGLEALPSADQAALAILAAAPGIHLIASVDSIWAPLAWDTRTARNFNFSREVVHTHQGYETEADVRYPSGLPMWTGLGKDHQGSTDKSLALVLRSLTNTHRELVTFIARAQTKGNSRGMQFSTLLQECEKRMIATSSSKLRHLLKELTDHEVVSLKAMPDGSQLYHLKFDSKTLMQLARGRAATGNVGDNDGDDEEEEEDEDE